MAAAEILAEYNSLKNARYQWESHWQDIAEVMLPRRAEFTDIHTLGDRRYDHLFDGAPVMGVRKLASSIDGLLKPRSIQWSKILPANMELMEDEEVKAWITDSQDRMFSAIYNKNAKFIQSSAEVDNDIVAFGTGILFIGLNKKRNGMIYRSYHLKDSYINTDGEGRVNTIFLRNRLTAAQAADRYGAENISPEAQDLLLDTKKDVLKKIEYIEVVKPSAQLRSAGLKTNKPYGMIVIEVGGESVHARDVRARSGIKVVQTSGFDEFPFAIPRWDTATGELYGRSPGMVALPDSNTLQTMGRTLLEAGHKIVHPPLLVQSESVIGTANTYPGGITTYDQDAAGRGLPVTPLNIGADIPLGREMQNDIRIQVQKAFFLDVLSLPTDGTQMTAYETFQRKSEFIQELGPIIGRLEADYTSVIAERTFNVMLRAGAFLPAPDKLRGQDIEFQYASPLEQAIKQQELAALTRSLELLDPFIQFNPEITDWFDSDAIAKSMPKAFGYNSAFLKTPDAVGQIREGRAQAQQEQKELENAPIALQAAEMSQKLEQGAQ